VSIPRGWRLLYRYANVSTGKVDHIDAMCVSYFRGDAMHNAIAADPYCHRAHEPVTEARTATRFRPDIEGLRGVAVLAVIAYHVDPTAVPRGFLGVDIFFVISGYLITGLMWRELSETGRLDILEFWARRIRRIAPAAITVLLALAIAALFIPDFDGRRLGRHMVAAALSFFNWHQITKNIDYLAHDDSANPVLHYWSLSIEEQFYLLWPLMLLGLLWFARRLALPVIGGLALLSLGSALCLAQLNPSLAFFGTGTRAWQLLAGAAVAIAPRLTGRTMRTVLAVSGLVLVVASITVAADAAYDQLFAVAATLGTALLLYAAAEPVRSALKVAPLAITGRISFSLYLWHWPLLVFLPATAVGTVSALGLAFAMAGMSYVWIERPARASRTLQQSKFLTYSLGAVLVACAVAAGAALISWGPNSQPVIYKDGCLLGRDAVAYAECAYGDIGSKRTVVLFGDSHAGNWFNALEDAAHRKQWRLLVRVKASCSPIDQPQQWADGSKYTECASWHRKVLAELRQNPPDLIVVSGARTGTARGEKRMLVRLAVVAPTVAVRDTPVLPIPAPKCLRTRDTLDCAWLLADLTKAASYPMISVDDLHPTVHVLDLNELACPGGVCRAMRDGRLTMFDRQHFTAAFSASMSPEFERLLDRYKEPGLD
jgi:peptidoglycan/LPS O-acetylase OafA/YrhL